MRAIVSALTAALLVACAHQGGTEVTHARTTPANAATTVEQSPESKVLVQKALLAQQAGDWTSALALYLTLAKDSAAQKNLAGTRTQNPAQDAVSASSNTSEVDANEAAYAKQAFHIAYRLGKVEEAQLALNLWLQTQPGSIEALTLKTLVALQTGENDDAIQSARLLASFGAESADSQYQLLSRLVQLGGANVLPLLNALAESDLAHPEAALLAAAIAVNNHNDHIYAMGFVERALEKNPEFWRAFVYRAELQVASGDPETAIAELKSAMAAHPDNRLLQLELGDVFYGQSRYGDAVNAFKKLSNADSSDPEARYLLAGSLFMSGDWTNALPLLQQSVAANYQVPRSVWLCGNAAERLKRWDDAVSCYDSIAAGSNYLLAQHRKASVLQRQHKMSAALSVLDDALSKATKTEDQTDLAQASVELLLGDKQQDKADAYLKSLNTSLREEPALQVLAVRVQHAGNATQQRDAMLALALKAENDDLRRAWAFLGAGQLSNQGYETSAFELIDGVFSVQQKDLELRYQRALLAENIGKNELAEADLREVIANNPNHIDALNALGYTLAEHNRELDEAFDLVSRANTQRPGSPAIIDSLAWVNYRKGNLKEATSLLAKAYAITPEAEIAAHYGEVLWRSGDKKKARAIWLAALEDEPDNKLLKARVESFK